MMKAFDPSEVLRPLDSLTLHDQAVVAANCETEEWHLGSAIRKVAANFNVSYRQAEVWVGEVFDSV